MRDLSLGEAILLLSLHDEKGTRRGSYVEYALAGAALADLALRGQLAAAEDKDGVMVLVDPTPTGNRFIDRALEAIKAKVKDGRARAKALVEAVASTKKLREPLLERLIADGILHREEKSFLFFRWDVHPEADPTAERALKDHLETVMFGSGEVAPEDAVLIALAEKTSLLRINFDKDMLREHKGRIETIAKGDNLATTATRATIDAVNTAVMVAVVLPTFVVVTSG